MAHEKLTDQRLDEASEVVRARMEAARERQRQRLAGTDIACNADNMRRPTYVSTVG